MEFMTESGFNILAYGHGSKLSFLRAYREKKLATKAVIWVNSFHSAASMKGLLNKIVSFCVKHCQILKQAFGEGKRFPGMHQMVDAIANTLQRNSPSFQKLYIFINSLDAGKLKDSEYLSYLS